MYPTIEEDKMALGKTQIIAIAAVAIVAVAGIAVAIVLMNNNKDTGITIVDDSGATITLSEPIKSAIVVNTNIPQSMKILGLENECADILFYSSSKYDDYYAMGFTNINKDAPLAKNITNAEYILSKEVKYVIAPVSSMTLKEEAVNACKDAGITVIKLNCNGDEQMSGIDRLAKLFGNTEQIQKKYTEFKELRETVINGVLGKCSPSDAKTFLCYFGSGDSFYNQNAELSKIIESIYGKNALKDVNNLDLSGISNKAVTSGGILEALTVIDDNHPIDKLFVRGGGSLKASGTSSKTVTNVQDYWKDTSKYALSYYKFGYVATPTSEVYVIDSDLLSGCMSHIGYVVLAELCGIDTGYDPATLITEFNTKYSFSESTTNLAFRLAFDGSGNCTGATEISFT